MMMIINAGFLRKIGIPLYQEVDDVIKRINDFSALPIFRNIVLQHYFKRLDLIKNSFEGKRPARQIESMKNVLMNPTNLQE